MAARGLIFLGAVLATGAGVAAVSAAPSGKLFTVAKHPVDATAKDAVTAKEKAHGEGQQSAFRALLKRIVPVTAYNRLTRLKQSNAADFVDGVAVRSERNSNTEYIASLDYAFAGQSVRDLLKREGVPFIDTQAPEAVIVPLVREGGGEASPRAQTLWANAWKDLDLDNTVTPLSLEAWKPKLPQDTLTTVSEGSGGADRLLSGEYGGRPVVVAVAEVDTAKKRVDVTLAGRDAVGSLALKRGYRMADGDLAYTMELAAVVALGTLEGRWKAVNAQSRGGVNVMTGPGATVHLEVEFSSLAQWNDVRQRLLDTPGVEDVRVESVSARLAEVSLSFPGGAEQLAQTLAPRGLSLEGAGGSWLLRSRR